MTYQRYARAEIDVSAVAHNVRALKGLTRRGTLFCGVVKADGYGHGAVEMARAVQNAGAERLAVATVEEGVELRKAGIAGTLQLLSEPPASAVDLILEHRLIPTVCTRQFAVALGRRAAGIQREVRYHLKIDTGMNRIGVPAEHAAKFAAGLKDFPGIELEGTFTHFATADVPGDWDFESQTTRFNDALAEMRTEGVDPGIVHAANSPATILHPEVHYDMVRPGLSLYGFHPSPETAGRVDLRAARSVKAQVSYVKRIGMGEGVSYGLTWRAAAPTTVATLPLGYADGIHRAASNSMEVLIGGKRCHQIGRICMDQFVVEVPRGVEVSLGDEAVIVGTQGDETITTEEFAEHAGTINYEISCGFGMRLPRIYT